MKSFNRNIKSYLLILVSGWVLWSCEGNLEPVTYSEISASNFYKTLEDVDASITSIYAEFGNDLGTGFGGRTFMGEWGTDEYMNNTGGAGQLNNFEWTSEVVQGSQFEDLYNRWIPAITRAGLFIETVKDLTFLSEKDKKRFIAEAQTARAIYLFDLLNCYGPCPVIIDRNILLKLENTLQPVRPEIDSYSKFIENELIDAAANLDYKNVEFGRFNKGIALTVLMKYYLQKKDWPNVEKISKNIMDLNTYSLNKDYASIWKMDNERNSEIIWAIPRTSNSFGQSFRTRTLHNDYKLTAETPKWNMDKIRFEFYDTFNGLDSRKNNLMVSFTTKAGKFIDMRDPKYTFYGAMCFKYGIDSTAKASSGIDVIYFRYADVLLSRAEALNEINGPNNEAITLVNQIRTRAGLPGVSSADKASKEAFRDHILKERGWEFFMEGFRREDLIRQGKYISYAHERGATLASDFNILYPIPYSARLENPSIDQNPGYDF